MTALWVFDGLVLQAMSGKRRDIWLSVHGQRPWSGRPAVAEWRKLGGKQVRITVEVLETERNQ